MEPPYPGPNLMLPALNLSGPPNFDHNLAYKKREAQWKRLVSETHKEWCLCGSYKNHFIKPEEPLCSSGDGEGALGATGGGEGDISLAGGGEGRAAGEKQ